MQAFLLFFLNSEFNTTPRDEKSEGRAGRVEPDTVTVAFHRSCQL